MNIGVIATLLVLGSCYGFMPKEPARSRNWYNDIPRRKGRRKKVKKRR